MITLGGKLIMSAGSAGGATLLDLSFYESAYGATIGATNVYVVDTSGSIQGSAVYSRAAGNSGTPAWALRTATTPEVSGSFRIAWHYVSGSSYTGDYAIDTVTIQGTPYNFDASSDNFITTSGTNTSSSTTALSGALSVPTTTGAVLGQWNRHTGGTGSRSTGPTSANSGSYYAYAETSGVNYPSVNFWLFSPVITV